MSQANKQKCPYCDSFLDTIPKRKKKCPSCGESIYVRLGKLLTEEDAIMYDWAERLAEFGVNLQHILNERESLSAKFGFRAPINDVIWSVMNKAIPNQSNPNKLEFLYGKMANFLYDEGKDPSGIVEEMKKVQIKRLQREVAKHKSSFVEVIIKVHTCNDHLVCENCKKASSRSFTVEEFLEEMPIPGECTNPTGCRCWIGIEMA